MKLHHLLFKSRPQGKFLLASEDTHTCRLPTAKYLLKHNQNSGSLWLCHMCGKIWLAKIRRDLPTIRQEMLIWREISMQEYEELIKYK